MYICRKYLPSEPTLTFDTNKLRKKRIWSQKYIFQIKVQVSMRSSYINNYCCFQNSFVRIEPAMYPVGTVHKLPEAFRGMG